MVGIDQTLQSNMRFVFVSFERVLSDWRFVSTYTNRRYHVIEFHAVDDGFFVYFEIETMWSSGDVEVL